jgi:3-hydroxyacyl-[acyl-carrier-protein] dehydratase
MNASDESLCFAPDHPALSGHFPQFPVVPGVLLLDAALHGIAQRPGADLAGPSAPPWQIVTVKFHRMVRAEESLRLEYLPQAGETLRFELHCGAELAMSGLLARRQP